MIPTLAASTGTLSDLHPVADSSQSPNSLPTQFVEDIATSLRQQDPSRLCAICTQIHNSKWHPDERVYLGETHCGTETNGLTKLVALTAIPHVAKSLQKLLLDVSGPRAQDDLLQTTLQTKPVTLGWQAKLTVPWVDIGDDKLAVEQMAELALMRMMANLSLVRARPRFLIAYDRGWEASSTSVHAGRFGSRNCDIHLTPFLSAWAKTSHRVQYLDVVGDAGYVAAGPDSPLGKGHIAAYASLRHLDLDLSQRDTTQPPHKLLKLLEAARDLETLKFRWNSTPSNTNGLDVLKPLQAAITRSHGIRDITLHGLHCPASELVGVFKRFKASLRTHKLARVEMSDVYLTDIDDGSGWNKVLQYLSKAFDLRELKLRFLCGEGLGVWCADGEKVEFAAQGRNEVRGLLQRVREKGRWVKLRADKQRRRTLHR